MDGREWRETTVLEHLCGQPLSPATDALPLRPLTPDRPSRTTASSYFLSGSPSYAPKVHAAFAGEHLTHELSSMDHPRRRHLEILLTTTPPASSPLETADSTDFVAAMADAVEALANAHARGVTHGDLSSTNLLYDGNQIVVLDWECGRVKESTHSSNNERTGTRDTMAVNQLMGAPHVPAHDVESLLVTIIKIVTQRFTPSPEDLEAWDVAVAALKWEWLALTVEDTTLAALRKSMWGANPLLLRTITQLLHKSEPALAKLLQDIARLNVPAWTTVTFEEGEYVFAGGAVTKRQWDDLRALFWNVKTFGSGPGAPVSE